MGGKMNKAIRVLAACLALAVGSRAANLTVTSPNGNENWPKGSPHLITWTSVAVSGNVKLILFKGGVKFGDIVASVPASQHSVSWVVGSTDAGTAPVGTDYKVRIRTLDNTIIDQSNGTFAIGPPSPGPGPAFALTSPNGGESWPLGSTRLITWNPGIATGSVRLDLYKGGTAPGNLVGWITSMTPAATGKYSWHVGDRTGMAPAALGEDYYIVIHAYTPDIRDPGNGPFTIAPRENVIEAPSSAKMNIATVGLSVTNPRRGDRWRKNTGYTIGWTSHGLAGAKIRVQLMKIDGATPVLDIADNIADTGSCMWVPPPSLPDAETYYKMRVQTQDGSKSDTAGPFSVAAGPASGPRSITVTAPGGPGQIAIGALLPVRWTSTCGTSANGPTDDGFDIDLMSAAGTTRIRQLHSGAAVYDGGSHNWHWDWSSGAGGEVGTFRVRVTNWSGHCVGLSPTFNLVHPIEITEYTIKPIVRNCVIFGLWCWWGVEPMESNTGNLAYWHLARGSPSLARVGYRWFLNNTWKNALHNGSYDYVHQVLLWSYLPVDADWYKDKGKVVLEAKIVITRKWAMSPGGDVFEITHPCLGSIQLMDAVPTCTAGPDPHLPQPMPNWTGPRMPVATGQGDTWEVDVTDYYRQKIKEGRPDNGWALLPYHMSDPGPGRECYCQYVYQDVEGYDVALKVRMAKDVE